MSRRSARIALVLALGAITPCGLRAQEASVENRPKKKPWNELSASWIDLQLHITAMVDGAFFVQDAESDAQVGHVPDDARFRLDNLEVDGQLRAPFPWSFQIEAEYDGMDQSNDQSGWTLSGLNVTIPVGKLFSVTIGNQSEGITMERLANSYDLVFMERSTMSSALTTPRQTGRAREGHGRWRTSELVGGLVQRLVDERPFVLGKRKHCQWPHRRLAGGFRRRPPPPAPGSLGGLQRGAGRERPYAQPAGGLRGALLRRHRALSRGHHDGRRF